MTIKEGVKNIDFETKLRGLFGIIAGIAILVEEVISGYDSGTIAGGIKDFAGTRVIVFNSR